MAYDATVTGKPNMIVLRDLASDVDHVIDEVGRSASGETTISPDGSKVAFERDCKNDLPCSFIMAVAGGEPDQICESCTPRGFSSNGSIVLVQNYNRDGEPPHTIAAIDLTSRTEKNFLRASQGSVYHAFFSWDDRWALRLEPATKRPVGDPFPYEHFHSSVQRPQGPLIHGHQADINLSVAQDKMVIDLPEYSADIWMTQVP
jgi:hypothetical protein